MYGEVLRLLRLADRSGSWPMSSIGRMKVMVAKSATGVTTTTLRPEAGQTLQAKVARRQPGAEGGVQNVKQHKSHKGARGGVDKRKQKDRPPRAPAADAGPRPEAGPGPEPAEADGKEESAAPGVRAEAAAAAAGAGGEEERHAKKSKVSSSPPAERDPEPEAAAAAATAADADADADADAGAAPPIAAAAAAAALRVGGTFSVGCLPKPLAPPKGNTLFPELMRACFLLERVLRPNRAPSSTIAINRHAQFRPHRDSGAGNGQSTSLIVALGDFTGGELAVEGTGVDIRYHPIEFDGWRERHWTLPFVGERYSLVWFTPLGVADSDLWWWEPRAEGPGN